MNGHRTLRKARRTAFFSLLALALCAASATGHEYKDPGGFSFTYSDDWFVVKSAALGIKVTDLPPETRSWMSRNKVDFSRMSVYLIRKSGGDSPDTLNVIVNHKEMPATESNLRILRTSFPEQTRAAGMPVDDLDARLQKIGKNEAIVIECKTKVPGVPFPVRNKTMFLPGGGKTYIVTCSGKADTFAEVAASFDEILASFSVPEPVVRADEGNQPRAAEPVARADDGNVAWYFPLACALGGLFLYFCNRLRSS
jgi:hypothetical protein